MQDSSIKRLSRLTALLTQLQTKRIITATALAKKFNVTVRTIYRDMRALEQAGVPIVTEEGIGYSLAEGYRVPPVMFTEREANALITGEQLILKNNDTSFVQEYTKAIDKIKSVLAQTTRSKANLLSNRVVFRQDETVSATSSHLSDMQYALTNFLLIKLNYQSLENQKQTTRVIEPFALYSTKQNWLLVAFCRLRNDFRTFRLDQVQSFTLLHETFEPHPITLAEYFEECRRKSISNP